MSSCFTAAAAALRAVKEIAIRYRIKTHDKEGIATNEQYQQRISTRKNREGERGKILRVGTLRKL